MNVLLTFRKLSEMNVERLNIMETVGCSAFRIRSPGIDEAIIRANDIGFATDDFNGASQEGIGYIAL